MWISFSLLVPLHPVWIQSVWCLWLDGGAFSAIHTRLVERLWRAGATGLQYKWEDHLLGNFETLNVLDVHTSRRNKKLTHTTQRQNTASKQLFTFEVPELMFHATLNQF